MRYVIEAMSTDHPANPMFMRWREVSSFDDKSAAIAALQNYNRERTSTTIYRLSERDDNAEIVW